MLAEGEVIAWISFSNYFLLYLYGGAHRASGAVTDRCGTYSGSGFDGFNGSDVQRCVGPNPGRKIRRPYWPVTKLHGHVSRADFIGFMVPFLDSTAAIYLIAIVFGFTYSGVMSAILVCTRMMVSANYAARAMSITSFFGWFGMGAGGFMGGYLFDLTGSYDTSFIAAMVVGCINLGILILFAARIRNASRLSIATHL